MSSCNTIPTLTSTNEVTSQSLLTTVSSSVVTSPPTTTTITTTIDSVVTTTISVVPGQTSTVSVTLTSTIPFTTTQTTTLFGTTCSTITEPTTPPTSIDSGTTTSSSSTSTLTSLSTAPNGSISTSTQTITASSSPSPTVIAPPSTNDNERNLAAIIGGSVGGGVGLIVLVLLAWFIMRQRRRRSKWDGVFSNEEMLSKPTHGAGVELVEPEAIPDPYTYMGPPPPPPPQMPSGAYEDAQAGVGGAGYSPGYVGRHPSIRPGQVMDYPPQGYYQDPSSQQTNGNRAGIGAGVAPSLLPNPYDRNQYPPYTDTYGGPSAPFDYNRYPGASGQQPPIFPVPAMAPHSETATTGESHHDNSGSNTPASSPNTAAALQPPLRDVKGGRSAHDSQTSLNARTPLIHTDAGRYQGPEAEANGRNDAVEGEDSEQVEETRGAGRGPAPPAYSEA